MTGHGTIGVTKKSFSVFRRHAGRTQTACERVPQVMNAHRSKILFLSRALPGGVVHGTDASTTVREDPDRMQAALRLDN